VVDVDGIHRAREALAAAIGDTTARRPAGRLRAQPRARRYDLSPAAMGRRALRNCALGYLMQRPTPDIWSCQEQFDAGHNMTDVIAALRCLVDADRRGRRRRRAGARGFYERWSRSPGARQVVRAAGAEQPHRHPGAGRALMGHEKFSLTNPNRVRALIGAFAVGNPLRFHAADGSGYASSPTASWTWTRSTRRSPRACSIP
jgi:aminopeptidase N